MSKGGARKGAGRPKGVANKSTELARMAIAKFVDENTPRLQEWLELIAQDSPKDAFNCVKDLMEYHLPKQARVENTHEAGEGMPVTVIIKKD